MITPTHLAVRSNEMLLSSDQTGTEQELREDGWLHQNLPPAFLALAEDHCRLSPEGSPQPMMVHSFSVDQEAPAGCNWLPLRDLVLRLPEESWLPAARAMAYANWHRGNRFCGHCGSAMTDAVQTAVADHAAAVAPPDELALRCTGCGQLLFPRISPAILAVVVKDGKLLLARNAANKQGFWSLIAGFMEPGERFEDCVRREVREEVGIEVQVEGYLGSQPWPFPDQLMIGFSASWVSGELTPDGVEIAEAGWFSPDQLPPVPRSGSLSRRLIDQTCKKLASG